MAEKMDTEASFESINAFGCLNKIKLFIRLSTPSLCKTSAAVSRVNVGIK